VKGVRRGDPVTFAVYGDYGKPRPALVVQSDVFQEIPSVTVLRLTSDTSAGHPVRIAVMPAPSSGLRVHAYVMIDKAISVPRDQVGVIGRLDDTAMREVGQALAIFLALDASSV